MSKEMNDKHSERLRQIEEQYQTRMRERVLVDIGGSGVDYYRNNCCTVLATLYFM